MAQILATTSGKGGVGKSTVATGLAFAFCRLGKKVLLVDMDEGLRCLDLLLGVDDSAVLDLLDALETEDLPGVAYSVPKENLFLIPAPTKPGRINPEKFKEFVKRTESHFDAVIFDFPAGLETSIYKLLPGKTLFLTVAVPDPVSVRDSAVVSEVLKACGLKSRLIINRFDLKLSKKRRLKGIDGIIDSAVLRLLGIVPEQADLNCLSVHHRISKNGRAMKAFLRIARRIDEEDVPLPKLSKI